MIAWSLVFQSRAFKYKNFLWLNNSFKFKMIVYRLRNICSSRQFHALRLAHSAAKQQSEIQTLSKQNAKITQSTIGITVASVENYSPISQVSVVVKAGSMYESPSNLGIVHCLRNAATLTTDTHTSFSITRSLEVNGSKLIVTSTKEHIIYTLQCIRDEIESALPFLADVATNKKFKPWEVLDMQHRMHVDVAHFQSNVEAVLLEELHKAAFRGGLSNSLYSPTFMIGKHDNNMLEEYVAQNVSSARTSVVGLGVNHDVLQDSVNHFYDLSNPAGAEGASKFGSGEVRLERDIPFVHTAIVAEAPGLLNTKDALSLGVLQSILESGPAHSKFAGFEASKLGEVASKSTNNPFTVSCININYANTGLFGLFLRGAPNDMKKLLSGCASQMREIAKNITDSDVQIAKHKLKARLRFERETTRDQLFTMSMDIANFGQIRDLSEIEKSIDALKTSDVTAIAAKVTKSKAAMASVGRLHATPHLDELL